MATNQKTPEELWKMTPPEFNKWREDNDLPKLFQFFIKRLPGFNDWMRENKLSVELLVKLRTPGMLFDGTHPKALIEILSQEGADDKFMVIEVPNKKTKKRVLEISDPKKYNIWFFTPYLIWAQKNCQKEQFINANNAGYKSTFTYTKGTAPDVPEACQWFLFGDHRVLKLGGLKVERWRNINGRNLDFTNLDFLEIEGDYHGNTECNIYYSHCDNLKLTRADVDFMRFAHCDMGNFQLENSKFNQSELIDCNIRGINSSNSSLNKIALFESSISGMNFNNTQLNDVTYIPKTRASGRIYLHEVASENFKSLRVAYSKMGNRMDTKACYFKERLFKLKSRFHSIHFAYTIKFLFKGRFRKFAYSTQSGLKNIADTITDLSAYILWGFGERPGWLFGHSLVLILGFGLIYTVLDVLPNEDYISHLYLSVFSFTRVGFVDVPNATNSIKLLIGLEALIGWTFIGLIISGFVNKLKY